MTLGSLRLRSRSGPADGSGPPHVLRRDWDFTKVAVVICDMWDTTNCVSAARRVTELAPRVNEVAETLRSAGALIVHAPAGCMGSYKGTAARARALSAPRVATSVVIDWNDPNPTREPPLPPSLSDDVSCSCASDTPCGPGGPPYPWSRQIESIEVAADDAVTDDGAELFGLLHQRGITDVLVVGVHTNRCVLGRPYGIRQLVYLGMNPVLCRDLTDSFHRDPRGHLWGTERVIAHIERHWCPTVTSDQLVGGLPFQFSALA